MKTENLDQDDEYFSLFLEYSFLIRLYFLSTYLEIPSSAIFLGSLTDGGQLFLQVPSHTKTAKIGALSITFSSLSQCQIVRPSTVSRKNLASYKVILDLVEAINSILYCSVLRPEHCWAGKKSLAQLLIWARPI